MKNKKAFTLIELLVVISIIGLISSIVLISIKGFTEDARMTGSKKFSSSIQHTLGSDAVGIWRFEKGSGTIAYDESSYGNNGTLGGTCGASCQPDWKSGEDCIFDSCLDFNSDNNDYIEISDSSSLNITDALTIEAWVKTATGANERGIIAQGSGFAGVTSPGYSLRIRQGVPAFALRKGDNSGYWDLYTGTNIEDGKWHHIVGTFDTSKMYKYLDGKLEQECDTGQTSLGALGFRIGVLNSVYGAIDEVRIHNRALDSVEIKKHYVKGLERHKITMSNKQ